MNGAVTVFSPWANLERDVAQGETEAGGMLLRTLVALGLGAILLSAAAQVTLILWHYSAAIAAVEQAEQRAVSVAAELTQALATASALPDAVHWTVGSDEASALVVLSSVTGTTDDYRWHADGRLTVQHAGGRNSERLANGLTQMAWQPDAAGQGGWLHVEAASDSQPFRLGNHYRTGCHAALAQACYVLDRYVARPALADGLGEASP
ncbi:hypothetical protein [Zymobacter sp. IVIA_5232.4 C2]|uniref:hypothetical protein n=1 Tax=Zymobacter sp. IVIA_5232.4 C2 TaxID=3394855 RepID=UPI0039C08A7F